ncbi:unnamed protein product [Clonostachys chloroleuca]|uniref:Uncharacterized protein n=1 Tax=Clonostachys chloroleuca TaxID=1926264 RepID=A0AA35Q3S6_9HYPO|nr:unnamed protein product [Clonostachys chloroleuca]CAI6089204.1 unnamed protein product [Clonostachys chloroleuca]CAI6091512.1 unnamed protein product [Clonostachys chloroleuca]
MSLLSIAVVHHAGNMRAIDAYFFSTSASTESGLNTSVLHIISIVNSKAKKNLLLGIVGVCVPWSPLSKNNAPL